MHNAKKVNLVQGYKGILQTTMMLECEFLEDSGTFGTSFTLPSSHPCLLLH